MSGTNGKSETVSSRERVAAGPAGPASVPHPKGVLDVSRRTIRFGAAAVAAIMASIYFLIGMGALNVGGSDSDRAFLWVFGALAGGAFLLGAILLLAVDRRWVWVAGLLFQVFVYWAYVDVSKTRTPPFEAWGITLRIVQLPLLAALGYLALRGSRLAPR